MAILGIRREDKTIWERRVPLTPECVRRLTDQGLKILVQRSERRCFPDSEFEAAGSELVDDIDVADVIIGVKEVPPAKIAAGKTYLIFSHTMKGQPYNMPLLRRILDQGCTLLDYELIRNDAGLRTVAFGRHAGLAGAIDTLAALGRRLAWRGYDTPLADLKSALEYGDVETARAAIEEAARRIADEGLPEEISPLAIGVTGEGGKVWSGAMEVLDFLPARRVEAEDLAAETEAFEGRARELWAVSYDPQDLVEPVDPKGRYSWEDYSTHPENYRARFAPHLRHLTAVIHGIFWAEGFPRFILVDDVRALSADGQRARLELITDITCDPGGSNELLARVTEPGDPSYVWDLATGETTPGLEGEGIALWAVDILPAEIPIDASRHFSEVLEPLVPHLARDDAGDRPDDPTFSGELRGAYLTVRGELAPEWKETLSGPLREHGGAEASRVSP